MLYLGLVEVVAPLVEVASYIALPLLWGLGLIPNTVFITAATLIFGAPFMRAGIAALANAATASSSPTRTKWREVPGGAPLAARVHQFATLSRAYGVLIALRPGGGDVAGIPIGSSREPWQPMLPMAAPPREEMRMEAQPAAPVRFVRRPKR